MEITRLGHSCFKLKGKKATLVTDPFDPKMVGIKFPKVEARIVTVSHSHNDHNFVEGVEGNPYIINGPGEYEVADVFIKGVASFHDSKNGEVRGKNTIYRIEIDGVHIVHLGDLGHKLLDAQTDELNEVDVLLIPTGGFYTIDSKIAVETVSKIEPKIVIPMHYNEDRLNQEGFAKLEKVNQFFSEMGKSPTILPKLIVTKDKLPQDLQVVALE